MCIRDRCCIGSISDTDPQPLLVRSVHGTYAIDVYKRQGLDMVYHCASGHLGGSFSAMDILTVLYFEVMNVDPKNPADPDRDRFVLSKGHCTPALYPILAQKGYFPEEDLALFRSVEGHLSGHAEMNHVKGVDMSTGSLGQGISAAVGMALAGKMRCV